MSEKSAVQTKKAECLSMTGYAQAKGSVLGWDARVSVKSVNHRFLDLKLRLPDGFDLYELRLRQFVRERIHRGHVGSGLVSGHSGRWIRSCQPRPPAARAAV